MSEWFDERKEAHVIASQLSYDSIYDAAVAAFKRLRKEGDATCCSTQSQPSISNAAQQVQTPSAAEKPLEKAMQHPGVKEVEEVYGHSGQAVDAERCEGCGEPSEGYDPEGVPLCAECAAVTLDLNKLTDNPQKRKVCPLHGQFQTNCGCTDEQIVEITHTSLSGQAVDRQEWTLEVGELADIIVIGYRRLPCLDRRTAKLLVDAHNAALAAERQRADNAERYERNANSISAELEKRLLSALAAIEKAFELLRIIGYPKRGTDEERMTIFAAAKWIQQQWTLEALESVDLSLLHDHDAALEKEHEHSK